MQEMNQCKVLMQAKLAHKDRELKQAWVIIQELRGRKEGGLNNS